MRNFAIYTTGIINDTIQDRIIEMQNFATQAEHVAYVRILNEDFNINSVAPIAKGLVQDPQTFSTIDVQLLIDQLSKLKETCKKLISTVL